MASQFHHVLCHVFVPAFAPSRLHSASVPSSSASWLTREYSTWFEAMLIPYFSSFSENSRICEVSIRRAAGGEEDEDGKIKTKAKYVPGTYVSSFWCPGAFGTPILENASRNGDMYVSYMFICAAYCREPTFYH